MFEKGYNFPLAVFAFGVEGQVSACPFRHGKLTLAQMDFLLRSQQHHSPGHTQSRVGENLLADRHPSASISASSSLLLHPYGVSAGWHAY